MPFLEALKLAISAILSHKLRSFLTLLGVIFGVATVIVVVSLIEGFNVYVDEKIADIGTNAFAVRKYSIDDFSSIEALSAARRRNKDITLEDARDTRTRRRDSRSGCEGAGDRRREVWFEDAVSHVHQRHYAEHRRHRTHRGADGSIFQSG